MKASTHRGTGTPPLRIAETAAAGRIFEAPERSSGQGIEHALSTLHFSAGPVLGRQTLDRFCIGFVRVDTVGNDLVGQFPEMFG